MYFPLSEDKHQKVQQLKKAHWKSETNSVWDKMQSKNFFQRSEFFFSDWILSSTVFVSDWICLGLNLSWTEFVLDWICLGLNLVLDWICLGTELCLGLHTAVVFQMQSFNYYFVNDLPSKFTYNTLPLGPNGPVIVWTIGPNWSEDSQKLQPCMAANFPWTRFSRDISNDLGVFWEQSCHLVSNGHPVYTLNPELMHRSTLLMYQCTDLPKS